MAGIVLSYFVHMVDQILLLLMILAGISGFVFVISGSAYLAALDDDGGGDIDTNIANTALKVFKVNAVFLVLFVLGLTFIPNSREMNNIVKYNQSMKTSPDQTN